MCMRACMSGLFHRVVFICSCIIIIIAVLLRGCTEVHVCVCLGSQMEIIIMNKYLYECIVANDGMMETEYEVVDFITYFSS